MWVLLTNVEYYWAFFNQFYIHKINLKSPNSLKSPIKSSHPYSPFLKCLHAYKLGFLSCIHISTGTRPPPLTKHQIYSRQSFQWIWAHVNTLKKKFNVFWQLLKDFGPHRVHKEFNSLMEIYFIYFTFPILLLYCWSFTILYSLPHYSNSAPQIQFSFPQFNLLVWHIFCHLSFYSNTFISLLWAYIYPFSKCR